MDQLAQGLSIPFSKTTFCTVVSGISTSSGVILVRAIPCGHHDRMAKGSAMLYIATSDRNAISWTNS